MSFLWPDMSSRMFFAKTENRQMLFSETLATLAGYAACAAATGEAGGGGGGAHAGKILGVRDMRSNTAVYVSTAYMHTAPFPDGSSSLSGCPHAGIRGRHLPLALGPQGRMGRIAGESWGRMTHVGAREALVLGPRSAGMCPMVRATHWSAPCIGPRPWPRGPRAARSSSAGPAGKHFRPSDNQPINGFAGTRRPGGKGQMCPADGIQFAGVPATTGPSR
jgi:hypothetical protein